MIYFSNVSVNLFKVNHPDDLLFRMAVACKVHYLLLYKKQRFARVYKGR